MDDRNNQLKILGHVCKFALKCKNLYRIGPSKNMFTIGPSPEVGEGQSQGKFFRSDGGGRRA